MALTADTLSSLIEFDAPFTITGTGTILDADVYAPRVENSDETDIYIESDEWEAFSVGYTGQDRYSGAVMHASETLSGALAADVLSTPGTYVVTSVETDCMGAEAFCTYDNGCDCEPAGWTVLKLK